MEKDIKKNKEMSDFHHVFNILRLMTFNLSLFNYSVFQYNDIIVPECATYCWSWKSTPIIYSRGQKRKWIDILMLCPLNVWFPDVFSFFSRKAFQWQNAFSLEMAEH